MEQVKKKFKVNPLFGVIWFAISMVALLLGGGYVQMQFGMAGLAITEIGLLALGLIPLLFMDINWKEMLPFRRPKVRHVVGMFLLWFGTFLLATLTSTVIGFFFPDQLLETGGLMNDLFSSVSPIVAFLVVAVMPAICEEVLHRGLILTTMKSIKKDWLIVLVMGLIFGVFHADPVRFLGTAILGASLTYLMLKTKNFLLPILFHMLNNSVSLLVTFATADAGASVSSDAVKDSLASGTSVAVYLILASAAPLILFFATRLLRPRQEELKSENGPDELTGMTPASGDAPKASSIIRPLVISAAIGAVMLVAGVVIIVGVVGSSSTNIIMKQVMVNDKTEPLVETLTIDETRSYALSYSMSTDVGLVELIIRDAEGTVVYEATAHEVSGSGQLDLEAGEYTATFTFINDEYEEYAKSHGYEYDEEDIESMGLNQDLTETRTADLSLILV